MNGMIFRGKEIEREPVSQHTKLKSPTRGKRLGWSGAAVWYRSVTQVLTNPTRVNTIIMIYLSFMKTAQPIFKQAFFLRQTA